MKEAEIKIHLFRLIDAQHGRKLQELYQLLMNQLSAKSADDKGLKEAYKAMAADHEREQEAHDWIEGTLNSDEL